MSSISETPAAEVPALCPCGSGKPFEACCGPIIAGAPAPTAEALMRSRYSAYVTCAVDHLRDSLDSRWQASFDEKATREWSQNSTWQGLTILSVKDGGEDDNEGEVEFIAAYQTDGQDQKIRERSKFRRRGGQWYYYDGKVKAVDDPVVSSGPKVGRNDPCPCGSGKKYKKCCG